VPRGPCAFINVKLQALAECSVGFPIDCSRQTILISFSLAKSLFNLWISLEESPKGISCSWSIKSMIHIMIPIGD